MTEYHAISAIMLLAVNETSCYCVILQFNYLPNNVLSLLLCYSIDSCYDH